MNKDVSLEVVTAPKGSKAVFTNKIFGTLYLKRTILFHYHHLGATIRHVIRLSLWTHSTLGLFPIGTEQPDAVVSYSLKS